MLFSEVYGSYFNVVAAVLREAVDGSLTEARLEEIVREQAFAESVLSIPVALKQGDWPLLKPDLTTPLRHKPSMPLTTLQQRWMKALLSDPRIQLFELSAEGLENAAPLYTQDTFVYFDRYTDGDPYEDTVYRTHFKTILAALRQKRWLSLQLKDAAGYCQTWDCIPQRLEYAPKEDRFRVVAFSNQTIRTISVARIEVCTLLAPYDVEAYKPPGPQKETLVLELVDERNTLERAMLHFSHLEKETTRLEENRYRIILRYHQDDEEEILKRILAFGPLIRVLSPNRFLALIRARLDRQIVVSG